MTVSPLDPATRQVTMTLAAIAATGATTRPSGESLPEQAARIRRGITAQLADTSLATRGAWRLLWLGLSPGNANLAYLAGTTDGSAEFAVVIRGTATANATDLLEDLDVGTVVPFTAGGSPQPVSVSKGAMEAFTQILGMSADGLGLVRALGEALRTAAPAKPTVYVTGHSLGGCIATLVAPYLEALDWGPGTPQFALSTFAAPTAGDQGFADFVDSLGWTANEHCYNTYDLIPQAWADLTVKGWYPDPGPAADFDVKALVSTIASLAGPNVYVQPGYAYAMNTDYGQPGTYDPYATRSSVEDFLTQVGFQHADSTYLGQVGAPPMGSGPVVTSLSPTYGPTGTEVTVNGSGFGTDPESAATAVDFGAVPCETFTVNGDGSQITCQVPDGTGVVDVRVTTILGTSSASLFHQFAYDGPQPALVYDISPSSGSAGTTVYVNGVGFAADPVVYFGNKIADVVSATSTEITVRAPLRDLSPTAPSTVNVRVRTNGYLTPTAGSNEFSYTG